MIGILIGLIVLLIIILKNHRAKRRGEYGGNDDETDQMSATVKKLNDEILAELEKADPDYEKLKTLRAEIDNAKKKEELARSQRAVAAKSKKSVDTSINGLTAALYAGSLLILAGVGGLVLSGAKETGLILLVLMTIVFYGGGILIRNNNTLKMASYVFTGTGMLMLPFLGLLIQDITKFDPSMLWLIMSVIGVPMYMYAAYIMQNKLFSYFALAGFVSLSCSLASVMGLALVWYFVFVMIIGILLNLVTILGYDKQLGVMQESVQLAGEWLPLATLIASFLAAPSLKELDYVIILGVALLHLIVGYMVRPNIGKENLIRLMLPAWTILFAHLLDPNNLTIGTTLACVVIVQLIVVFFNVSKGLFRESFRNETELCWMIVSLISLVVAGVYLGDGNMQGIYAWVSVALAIDSALLVLAKLAFKQDSWYAGLIATGIALPLTITGALGPEVQNASLIHTIAYLAEMVGMLALWWKNKEQSGDVVTVFAVGAFGIAALATGWEQHLQSIVLMLMAACYFVRGYYSKNNVVMEIAVYCTAAGVYFVLDWVNANTEMWKDARVDFTLIAHLALVSLVLSNYLWGGKTAPYGRLMAASLIVMIIMGGIAISGANWAMYLFLLEVVAIMLFGLFMKDRLVRNAGIVGIFLAVLWFTKDLSFVWPIILGLGIIGTVVFILLSNGQKMPPQIPDKQ